MSKFQRTIIASCLGIVAFFALLGWAGDIDHTEQVILNMSQDQYDSVKHRLTELKGTEPSDRDIAHWWTRHHEEVP